MREDLSSDILLASETFIYWVIFFRIRMNLELALP